MKIVFMGTPDFASGALEALIAAGHEITAVYTQPDKPKGRGKEVQMTPVKVVALEHGIPVYQPRRIREAAEVEVLRQIPADIFVVAAFGQILTQEILDMPKYGCVNIHASLLPKYRGAAPINQVIVDGEEETGVTIQQMALGCDTGDMLTTKVVAIDAKETAESLFEKLAIAGAELIVETLPRLEAGEITPVPQDESQATHVRKMDKSFGKIDWTKTAVEIERLIRGLNSWPSAYTYYQGKSVKLWAADVIADDRIASSVKAEVGTIVEVAKDYFDVSTGNCLLRVTELQLEGKKRMDTKSFLLGNAWKAGFRLGE